MIVLLVLVQLNHTTQLILCQGKNTTQIIELKKLNLETYNQALDYLRRLLKLQRKSVKHKDSHSKPINLFFLSIKNTIISKINITNNLIIFTIIKLIYNINIIII
jgi:hypothetical protein